LECDTAVLIVGACSRPMPLAIITGVITHNLSSARWRASDLLRLPVPRLPFME
jgi:hypothetical protein